MIKRILSLLLAVLLGVAVLPAQAEDDYQATLHFMTAASLYDLYGGTLEYRDIDFTSLPRLDSIGELVAFMGKCRDYLARQVPIRLTSNISEAMISEALGYFDWESQLLQYNHDILGDAHVLITMQYFPGARIAELHRTGDTAQLSGAERTAYQLAMAFFNTEYPWRASAIERERSIFDFIRRSATYWTDNGEYPGSYNNFRTAVGVLVDGKANCSGFADAFYMLCKMAGFSVDKVTGELSGGGHVWNTIEIDGRWYMVDATPSSAEDDPAIRYCYFNAGQRLMAQTHTWTDMALRYPIAQELDSAYAYGNAAFVGYYRVADPDAIEQVLAEQSAGQGSETYYFYVESQVQPTNAYLGALSDGYAERMRSRGIHLPYGVRVQMGTYTLGSVSFLLVELGLDG